jgi:Protein of unknown function (DUF4058)
MPIHDWTRVKAGIFHDFHHALTEQIKRDLNAGLLPSDYYALTEQVAAGLGPDVLTLHAPRLGGDEVESDRDDRPFSEHTTGTAVLAPPRARPIAETDMEYYRRKQSTVTVRHVSDDRVVAVIEVVSPGNKSTLSAREQFVRKAAEFLEQRVHLLILDLLPPGRHDPRGMHGAIWDYVAGQEYSPPPNKPLTLAAYESDLAIRAYVESVAVGDRLPDMPLFLEPDGCIYATLEATYQTAWEAVPSRWKAVLERPR